MQIDPTVIYAIPKKGFFPPNQLVVLSTTDFVPWNELTGNSMKIIKMLEFDYYLSMVFFLRFVILMV